MKEKNTITAILGGSFKPPHSGHFDIVKETLNKYPEINNFKILIGSGIRNNITQEMSFKIWEIYKKYLPNNIILENSVSPIGDIKRYAKNNPTEDIYFVLGTRNNNDLIDIKKRTKDLHKYPNIEVKIIETNNLTQGKLLRENLNNISPFLPTILSESDKINIQNILKEITSTEVKYWALYAYLFNKLEKSSDPKTEYEDLKNKLDGEKLKALDYFYNEFFITGVSTLNENATYSQDIDYKQHIKDLSKYYLTKYPNLKSLPKVKFIHGNKENAKHLHTKTGYYDPNNKTIVIYTEGRHPRDIISTFSHEMVHYIQDTEGRLDGITTTNTQEDDYLNNIEKEAYLDGNINFRNWKDSIKNNPEFGNYYEKYKKYALTELFEKDLPNIENISPTEYIVGNGDDIEALYYFKPASLDPNDWEIHWKFTDNNKNESPEAWKQVTATSYKILKHFIDNKNPKSIEISGNTDKKTKIYKSYIEKLENIFNNQYKIDNSNQHVIYLNKIEEICKSGIKKRMETLNESYEQSLNYWQNGDLNAKSKIERWKSVKKLIERNVISELYNIDESLFLDIPKFNQPKLFTDKLQESLSEIKLTINNAVDVEGNITDGKFTVGEITYKYKITEFPNPYNDSGSFYSIHFHPESNQTSIPQEGRENYIKILSTMYKIIKDFSENIEPNYIGISSLDNNNSKNYHKIYANLTDNKYNNLPGYFRKDVSLPFNSPQGKGRFVVLKRKNVDENKDPYGLNAYAIELAKGLEEEMNEGKQVGNLYHYTLGEYLYNIIESNTLFASSLTSYGKDDRPVNSISFTRDPIFHYKNRKIMGTDARIQLDGNKLSQKYKIQSFADKDFRTPDSKEAEERITFPNGDNEGIKNLEQYVISYDVFLERIQVEDLLDLIDLFQTKKFPVVTNLKLNNSPGQPVVRYYLTNTKLLNNEEIMEIYNKVKK